MSVDLGSARILLTGGTGFVGQAILERLLSGHPGTTVLVLARPKGELSAQQRVEALLEKPVFSRWRATLGDEAARRRFAERVQVVEGDLGALGPEPERLDLVLHSASSVNFDDPIDRAFATNVTGVAKLYQGLLDAGADPHVVHISTAYVNAARKGPVIEGPVEHEADWRAEEQAARSARTRVDERSRAPEELRRFLKAARQDVGKVGPQAVAEATEAARRAWVDAELVEYGRARAQSLGWTDAYTLTKALAERLAEELWLGGEHRLSIVRPSIIESALRHPYPGWIDGFKVADPLIVAYGRGHLPEFPGIPDSVLDVVPVDFVVNAALAAAATAAPRDRARYFHVVSGTSNPLPMHQMYENIRAYYTAHPIPGADGPTSVPAWQFPGGIRFEASLSRKEVGAKVGASMLSRLPATPKARELADSLASAEKRLRALHRFSELYQAYVQAEVVFDDAATRTLDAETSAGPQDDAGFDVTAIDWAHYLQEIHLPSIAALPRRSRRAQDERTREPLAPGGDVLAVFDLEGTVLHANLVQQYLWLRDAERDVTAVPREFTKILALLPRYLAAERRDRSEFIRSFLRLHKGMRVDDIKRYLDGRAGRRLRAHLLADALARVEEHRAAGHHTVLVTGGVDLLADVAAPWFDEVVASGLHSRDGVLTGYLAAPPVVGEARAAWLRGYAASGGFDLAKSYGYGDSQADTSWLRLLGNPVAVNPDQRLYGYARAHHWNVVEWRRTGVPRPADLVETAAPDQRAQGGD
ncbi:MAG: HAD-IB family hydrolase [Actinobacteria bacterium HGW-Actinobacteria-5]|nr:MAG: HAD-IB family hydrolase [Actinobacteria bacterium HGW-Actinobacteria-5]